MTHKIVVSCSVKGEMYQGERSIELYAGNDQKTIDANKGLVDRIQREMKKILYNKYLPIVEAEHQKKVNGKKMLLERLQKDDKTYYKVERWVYGQCEGVVKRFAKDEFLQLKLWLEDNMEGSCALVVLLTNGVISTVVDNIWD